MMSLVYKDLMNLKQQGRIYILIMGIWAVVAGMERNPAFLGGVLSVFSVLVAITAYAYDEKAGWDKYALTMPVGKKELVLSKYVLAVLMMACSMVLFLGLNAVLRTPEKELFDLTCIFLALGLLAMDVILPLIFRFGVEKGRVIMILAFLILSVIGLVGSELSAPVLQILSSKLFNLFLVAAGILLLPVSVWISFAVYRRKEF
ncbi:MAG: ABC-2 transporter permease [Lachnospiraceae bacterium]|nr:ABC-2 transporter permease [Lachnospiraceae bacterium]